MEKIVEDSNIKRLEEPLAVRPTPLGVVTHELGVIVVNLALAYGNQGTAARLVAMVVVQANLAEGGHGVHLMFKRPVSLTPRTPVDGSGHLAHDVFQVLDVYE